MKEEGKTELFGNLLSETDFQVKKSGSYYFLIKNGEKCSDFFTSFRKEGKVLIGINSTNEEKLIDSRTGKTLGHGYNKINFQDGKLIAISSGYIYVNGKKVLKEGGYKIVLDPETGDWIRHEMYDE